MIATLMTAGLIGDAQPAPVPWWFWIVLFLALVVILWWLWFRELSAGHTIVEEAHGVEKAFAAAVETPAVVKAASVLPGALDDLKIIEGIGPKINTVLHGAGIRTFADLASADSAALKKILLEAGLRLADPTTWPQQSALARDGRLDDLKALQDSLNAGRK